MIPLRGYKRVTVLEVLVYAQIEDRIWYFDRKTLAVFVIVSNDNFQLSQFLSSDQLLVLSIRSIVRFWTVRIRHRFFKRNMRNVWITDIKKPIKIDNRAGSVAVHSVAIKFPTQFELDHLFTYREKGVKMTYPIEVGRTYTLSDLLTILGKMTSGFFGTTADTIVLRTMPSDAILDVTFPAPIQTMLGLDKTQLSSTSGKYMLEMGSPINKADVVFTTTIKSKLAIITCDEVDNHDEDGDVLAILCIDDIKKYQFNNPPSRNFERNYDKLLHVKIKDELGNELPIKESLIRLTINEQRLRNRENIPYDTTNSTT